MRQANNEAKSSRTIRVHLLDGTALAFTCTQKTKVRHALLIISDTIGLKNDGDYGLCILRGGFASNDYTDLVDEEAYLLNVLGDDWSDRHDKSSLLELEHGVVKAKHLVLKRRIYLPWSPLHMEVESATKTDDAAHRLEYIGLRHLRTLQLA